MEIALHYGSLMRLHTPSPLSGMPFYPHFSGRLLLVFQGQTSFLSRPSGGSHSLIYTTRVLGTFQYHNMQET